MLCLSRKLGEALQIGDGVRVVVVKMNGNRVTLGVEASREIPVVREELTLEKVECLSTSGK